MDNGYDEGEDYDSQDEPMTAERWARIPQLVKAQAAVEAVADPDEKAEAARWFYASLAGLPEPLQKWEV
jgi:hypothetical protein